ncbi:hypothetical protein AURDEDRAFT_114739 [Auricularia subglabra TFB-10046 SS5]|nr:hypothetical protein AURDEDRAFT_114739 [Auricularia subglabra TFB-10046 SS5]
MMRPSATCPRLRVLTLYLMHYSRSFRVGPSEVRYESDETWTAIGIAIALRRICKGPMPQLDLLTIVSQYDADRVRRVNCSPPLPAVLRVALRTPPDTQDPESLSDFSWSEFPIVHSSQTNT